MQCVARRSLARPASQSVPCAGAARILADRAAESLVAGGVLPYSQRQRLLRLAGVLGLARFEANLVIAAVQHRHGPLVREAVVFKPQVSPRTRSGFPTLRIVAAIQSLIVLACWLVLTR
jgi:hypothetical protein